MGSDFWLVLAWWGTLFLVGAAAFPLTRILFNKWHDRGYLFAKSVGMALISWLVYVLGTLYILPFNQISVIVSLIIMLGIGVFLNKGNKGNQEDRHNQVKRDGGKIFLFMVLEEVCFFLALLFWAWVKGHEPSIRGLEKFMDFGFMQSILNSRFFPPADIWYPPYPINYYYFGHLVVAVLTKLSSLDLVYTFNLMLATIFALCLTMSFSIGYQLSAVSCQLSDGLKAEGRKLKALLSGILTAFLVTLAGNMQTIYAFTQGYTGDEVKPFWQLLWPITSLWQRLPEGLERYWYANATRFIPFTIHEFPSYSFVVSDIHGHVLSIPFVLLAIGLVVHVFTTYLDKGDRGNRGDWGILTFPIIFYGFLIGVLFMTNVLDAPVYFALLAAILIVSKASKVSGAAEVNWKAIGMKLGVVVVAAGITSLPFLAYFKSFVNGLAVNCPPAFLANTKFGPLLFEGIEKCQRSPLWMMWLLWGFFIYCGIALIMARSWKSEAGSRKKMPLLRLIGQIWETKFTQTEKLLVIFFLFSVALIIFPEFFYFKDIYPAHFRSNTMFKLGYQAFILFSIVAGYSIVRLLSSKTSIVKLLNCHIVIKKLFVLLLIPQLFLVSIYPIFSVRSYFGELKNYEGIEGLGWLRREYADNYLAIQWLKLQLTTLRSRAMSRGSGQAHNSQFTTDNFTTNNLQLTTNNSQERFTLVEADGDSFTDYNHFSAFTGIPTIIGWAVHEWLWRGTYDIVSPRREEVRLIYESPDVEETKSILHQYAVRYIIVGILEREKFKELQEAKFYKFAKPVFRYGQTAIYEVLDNQDN